MELTIKEVLEQGISAHRAGNLQEADRLYTAIIKAHPKHPDANHNLGVLAVGVGKVESALPLFRTALETNPKEGQFWFSYIDALIALGQLDNARQVLDQGKGSGLKGDKVDDLEARLADHIVTPVHKNRNLDPSQEQIDGLISLYSGGNLEAALAQGITLATAFPNNATIPNILGAIYSGLGKLQEAIDSYNKAIELRPNFSIAYSNRGVALKDLKRHKEAITSYYKSIRLKPNHTDGYYNLGIILNILGRSEEAILCFDKASKCNPDHAETYSNLGNVLRRVGKTKKAIRNCKRAIELKPDFPEAHNNLGNALRDLGKIDEALKSYKLAIALGPNFSGVYVNFGQTLFRLEKLDQSMISYKRSLFLHPKWYAPRVGLSEIFQAYGEYQEAVNIVAKNLTA